MKSRKIINIILVACIAVGIVFIIKFDVFGKIENRINEEKIRNETLNKAEEAFADEPEFITETFTDKNGNEIVIEYKKRVFTDGETGEEILMYEDTAERINIFYYIYEGTIEKIEDNKIYFIVDRENKEGNVYSLKNVKDYEIVFDINTFNLESDPSVLYSVNDGLIYESRRFFKASNLNFLIGKRVKIHFSEWRDPHILEIYKILRISNI
jgi:hypothetical protein